MTSLWRQAFDAIERPLAAAAESWVQSKTFMDLAAVTIRAQRRLTADGQRMTEQWLHAWGMPARGDLFTLMNQVASLERQMRDLGRELQLRNSRPPASHLGPPAAQPPAEAHDA
jgi:Poly(R)-hydroxyalkanoic acid synthase subunit (PHA_synth_III_E)